jgi:hypothetical protein
MRFARDGDHIASHKNSRRPSYRRQGALQRSRWLRINFRDFRCSSFFDFFKSNCRR